MVEFLLQANSFYLQRDEALLADKFTIMAEDPFDFFRGSAPWYWKDLENRGHERALTHYINSPEAASLLLTGDLHPENIGTSQPGLAGLNLAEAQAPTLEAIDLDAATFGPWILDVRRAAVGLELLLAPLKGCDRDCQDSILTAFATAYFTEITQQSTEQSAEQNSLLLSDLLSRSLEEGSQQLRLNEWTSQQSHLILGETPSGDFFAALNEEESAQLERLLQSWGPPQGFRKLDAARRLYTGVASRPALRYTILWDQGKDGPEDDLLLEFREVLPPPVLPAFYGAIPARFDSGAQRIQYSAQVFWSRSDADILYDGMDDGVFSFKAYNPERWFQHFQHDEIKQNWEEGRYNQYDLAVFAQLTGQLLASAHARGSTPEGSPALPILAQELGSDLDAFIEELVENAQEDGALVRDDHSSFEDALKDYGPLLGKSAPEELR
jgi:uncharacterized protein (DUF2252 family)